MCGAQNPPTNAVLGVVWRLCRQTTPKNHSCSSLKHGDPALNTKLDGLTTPQLA